MRSCLPTEIVNALHYSIGTSESGRDFGGRLATCNAMQDFRFKNEGMKADRTCILSHEYLPSQTESACLASHWREQQWRGLWMSGACSTLTEQL